MNKEDKELLLRDLSARLPYGVKIELMPITRGKCVTLTPIILRDYFISDDVNYLPYLRPMSSMTEVERLDFYEIQRYNVFYSTKGHYTEVDWLNAHHFDYRGLIEKGLAIAITENNNPYKTID